MSLDREGAPQAVVAWGLFRIPKGLKCVERRGAGRGAGVHAPQAEFTFRTYCRQTGRNPVTSGLPVIQQVNFATRPTAASKAFATALGTFNRASVRPLICRPL